MNRRPQSGIMLTRPKGYVPAAGVDELLRRYGAGERYFAGSHLGEDANLAGAKLMGVNLHGAFLVASNLEGADLDGANLQQADLLSANLRHANLQGAWLIGARLEQADLSQAILVEARFDGAHLRRATLHGANLERAGFWDADLRLQELERVNLRNAAFIRANLSQAKLGGADLQRASLLYCNLMWADLTEANLSDALLHGVLFSGTKLTGVQGLDTVRHEGPSIIDYTTVERSGDLPITFLQAAGLRPWEIEGMKLHDPRLTSRQITELAYHVSRLRSGSSPLALSSCFISHSSTDHLFARRLYADLQGRGVRCFFAPHDLPIGASIRTGIDEAIQMHDRLLLILSESAMQSQWIQQEVETALARERREPRLVLFPVRIDNAVLTAEYGWPALIRNTRNIGDFTDWNDPTAYSNSLERLLRDLRNASSPPVGPGSDT